VSPAVRRAAGLVLVGVLVAIACTFLGRWQWNRHVWRDGQIAIVNENYSAKAVPLRDVLPTTTTPVPAGKVWHPVKVVGHYLPDATVLLRNRPSDDGPVYHVLVPFLVEDSSAGTAASPTDAGSVLLVDRGWVPTGADGSVNVTPPAPPSGTVTLTARLREDEPASRRAAPEGQVQAINVAQALAAGGSAVPAGASAYEGYGGLVSEDPAPAAVPGALPAPDTDPGPHLSYAFQWWVFALGGLIGFLVLARRDLLEERALEGEDEPDAAPAGDPLEVPEGVDGLWPTRGPRRPTPPRRPARSADAPYRRGGRDEDYEDAIVDAQLGTHDGADPARESQR
jgi:cytochrome oxidase assembly protein ShyY1